MRPRRSGRGDGCAENHPKILVLRGRLRADAKTCSKHHAQSTTTEQIIPLHSMASSGHRGPAHDRSARAATHSNHKDPCWRSVGSPNDCDDLAGIVFRATEINDQHLIGIGTC